MCRYAMTLGLAMVLVCSSAGISDASAGEPDEDFEERAWFFIGLPALGESGDFAIVLSAAEFGVGWQMSPSAVWNARLSTAAELCILATGCATVGDFAFLRGIAAGNDEILASVSAGPSVVFGRHASYDGVFDFSDDDPPPPERYMTFGLGLQAQLFLTPTDSFSFGLTIPANFNARNPYAAAMVAVRFGRLR